jgi:voltage-gated potassium channel
MRLGRFVLTLTVPLFLVLVGMVGYCVIEGWGWFDALYMSVITLATIGYMEVHPLTTAGRVFTMVLTGGGVFTIFYAATTAIRVVVSGELQRVLGRQRMERSLAGLSQHIVVCGYGRMGHLVCREFSQAGEPFVVIEKSDVLMADFAVPHGLALHGDATLDEMLVRAGVTRARALITVVGSNSDNLFIAMSARLLADKLYIVARAEDEAAEQKLVRVGANRVVSPYAIGGHRVALAVLRPAVVDFIELATRSHHLELQIEETRVMEGSALAGLTVRDSPLGRDLGVILVAIKRPTAEMVFKPTADTLIQAQDTLLTLGSRANLDRLEQLASSQ